LERRESCQISVLGEDPGMASSSKGRASSRKRSRAGKPRVISTKRKDALPRTGSVSAGRRKPVVLPLIDALTKPPAKMAATRAKKAHSLHQKERTASRKKTTRAAGRASAQPDELTAMEIAQALSALEPVTVTALEPVADTIAAVEPPATAYEEFAVTAVEAPEVEAVAVVDAELEVEASAIVEELPIEAQIAPRIAITPPPVPEETRAPSLACATVERPALAPPPPDRERRGVMPIVVPAISRLLSTLSRWTGVSGTK
jgi:hypothetical protein